MDNVKSIVKKRLELNREQSNYINDVLIKLEEQIIVLKEYIEKLDKESKELAAIIWEEG